MTFVQKMHLFNFDEIDTWLSMLSLQVSILENKMMIIMSPEFFRYILLIKIQVKNLEPIVSTFFLLAIAFLILSLVIL